MDIGILNWIQTWTNPFLDSFFSVYTRLGDHAEVWLVLILILLFNKKTRKVGILALFALVVEIVVISGVLKPIIMRPRPFTVNPVDMLIDPPKGSSFPSGHAASSFAIAATFYFNKIRFKPVYITMAVLMAFSRLYAYVHYPSDVLVGALIGILIGYLVTKYQETIFRMIRWFTQIFLASKHK